MGTRPAPPHAGYQGAAFGSGQRGMAWSKGVAWHVVAWHVMTCCGALDTVLLLGLALPHQEAVLRVALLRLPPLLVEERLGVDIGM
jgi:hypothetical protein